MPRCVLISMLMAAACCDVSAPVRANSAPSDDIQAKLGTTIADFELLDPQDQPWRLSAHRDDRPVVLAFLGTECPLVRLYMPRFVELAHRYESRGVLFVGVFSNRQDSAEEIRAFDEEFAASFPLVRDERQTLADQCGATRTPEIFVLDADGTICYTGRIDDQYGVGFRKPGAGQHYVRDAVDDLLAGREVRRSRTQAFGCLLGRDVAPDETSPVTWSNQISRIFQQRCQECHRPGEIGPFPLMTYDDVVGWGDMIREVVADGRMPPWHASPKYGTFVNDARLSDEERQQIYTWVEHGSPEGDPADLPPIREFPSGWTDAEPDRIVYMTDEPVTVPAEGRAIYRFYFVDPGFEEDVWLKGAVCKPGNTAVVHHINVYYRPPWDRWSQWQGGVINLISGYLPGQAASNADHPGTALFVPAGSELVFEMHYTPNGTVQTDRSALGLVFADPDEVEREGLHLMAYNDQFVIPPGAAHHRVEASYTFEEDMQLLFLCPHMHLRGDDFLYEAHYPDGRSETLLLVDRYDYEWQTAYWLAKPKPMPAGTRIDCVAHFDNSSGNPRNPDPTATVRWSGYTEDEMMVGTLGVSRAVDPSRLGMNAARYELTDEARLARGVQPGVIAGDRAMDRGLFLLGKGDRDASFAQFNDALAAYREASAYGPMLGVWIAKGVIVLGKFKLWVLGYLAAINLLTLGLYAIAWLRGSRTRLRGWLVALALAGGTPAALLGQLIERFRPVTSRWSLPWLRIMATQATLLAFATVVFLYRY